MASRILSANSHTFDTIVGQDIVKQFLIRAVDQHRLPKALLFTGPEGVGKKSLMFALAKHLVAGGLAGNAEAIRRAHGKIERGTHPDVILVEPKSASGQILKEQVDEMHERAHFAPLESRFKLILISPIEAMNQVAANHLLKLLEEPPPAVYMCLASQQIHQVLTTIRSRCALLRCPPVEMEPLTEWLMKTTGCLRRKAETAARLSGGRAGLAVELVSGEDEERRRRISSELEFFQREGYPSIFRVARNLLETAGGSNQAIGALRLWFRDLLVASLTADEGKINEALLINRDMTDVIEASVQKSSIKGLAKALEHILSQNNQALQPFVDADLLLEVLLTDLGVALKTP